MSSEGSPQAACTPEPTAAELWSAIPLDTDILITHTPPHRHCDRSASHGLDLGCEDLRRALWRVRPRLHVCGHIHEAHGAERVRWEIDSNREGTGSYAEAGVEAWEDPSPDGNKISLVDLTARGGKVPLDNDGSQLASALPSTPDSEKGNLRCGRAARSGDFSDESPLGLGGDADRVALLGRMGRQETCVVNAAIAATSWPHVGGKRFHKPVVVDLDLPVWEAQDGMGT